MKIYKTASYKKIAKKKDWDPNPWAVCTESVGREDEDKYERCVQDVKKKQKKKADVGEIWTPAMEEELEQKELEKKKKRRELKDDFISPHIRRPGKGRGISRKQQRRGLNRIVTDDDWEKIVDKVKNKELDPQLANSKKNIKKAKEEGFPESDELEKGRFTEYCKRQGFEGPCKSCAEKALESDDASVRGMASFYLNTVKP